MQRSYESYSRLIELLSAQYGKMEYQGLESYLFPVDGRLLKIYQWFLLDGVGLAEELKLWQYQQQLLSIYAPRLEAQVIALSPDAVKDAPSGDVFCYGILMARGEPFVSTVWSQASAEERRRLAETIGRTLAERHLAAPQQAALFHADSEVLSAWTSEVLEIIGRYPISSNIVPDAASEIVGAIKHMIQNGEIAQPLTVPLVHGDLNLSNIVLSANELQFIDPGPALLFGIGIKDPKAWTLDVWWDVVVFANALLRQGIPQARDAFLRSYCDAWAITIAEMEARLRYWEALHDLMVVAICCKRWQDFQDAENPFAQYMQQRGLSLHSYTQYFFAHSLQRLHIAGQFPHFIAQVQQANFSF